MPLHWSIEKCKNWEELANDRQQEEITNTLVFQTMTIGVNYIKDEKTALEFFRRVAINEKIRGALLCRYPADPDKKPEPCWITLADCVRRIGMHTNASPISPAKFWKQIVPEWAQEWATLKAKPEQEDAAAKAAAKSAEAVKFIEDVEKKLEA